MRLIIGISGASGVIYGIRLLESLKNLEIETHLVITSTAEKVIQQETGKTRKDVEQLGTHCYKENDLTAPIASGSFKTSGMVIIPCSMKTLAGIAWGFADNLLIRAADVTLKEQRKLIVVPRETPLSTIHLRNMLKLANIGAVILPPIPSFYNSPKTLEDIIDQTVGKVLDHLGIENTRYKRWGSQTQNRNTQRKK
jgi:4-hydroxy-3-polyprenylbenzoate decarboxylase